MRRHRGIALGIIACAAAGALVAWPVAASEASVRAVTDLARALDRAVRDVSRPSATSVFGPAQATRGYHIPGVGIVLVVPPRRLPAAPPAPPPATIPDIARRRPGPMNARDAEMERALRAYQEQALAMHEAATQAQREAEQVLAQMVRVMEGSDGAGTVSMPAFPPPPWLEWLAHDGGRETRTPDAVVADVKRGILEVLASRAPETTEGDEGVIAVVEFHSDEIVHPEAPAARTLVLRIDGADLDALRRGDIAAEELEQRAHVTSD